MRTTTAFFAGAGTIAVALAAGLGGGLLISNIVSPHAPKQGAELSKVERRTTDPIPASNPASESSPYIEATQAAATKPVTVSPAPQAPSQEAQQQQAQPQQAQPQQAQSQQTQPPQPQTQQANATPAPVPRRPRSQLIGNPRAMRTPLRPFPTRNLPRPRRKPLRASHLQLLTMRSPGRAMLTSNASCAVPRRSARPNAACNGWRSAATAVAGMTSCAMSSRRSAKKPTRRAFSRPSR